MVPRLRGDRAVDNSFMPSPPKNPEPSDQVRSTPLAPYVPRSIVASPRSEFVEIQDQLLFPAAV
jgi:hypothetical protein